MGLGPVGPRWGLGGAPVGSGGDRWGPVGPVGPGGCLLTPQFAGQWVTYYNTPLKASPNLNLSRNPNLNLALTFDDNIGRQVTLQSKNLPFGNFAVGNFAVGNFGRHRGVWWQPHPPVIPCEVYPYIT